MQIIIRLFKKFINLYTVINYSINDPIIKDQQVPNSSAAWKLAFKECLLGGGGCY